jgi:SAM-dependent methyltransferase
MGAAPIRFTTVMNPEYEQLYYRVEERHWWMCARRQLCAWLVQQAVRDDARILEIGCSGGLLLQQLRAKGYRHLTGIDISPAAIERSRARGLPDTHVMDAQKLTLGQERFDVIVASDVLEHLADDNAALTAWRETLRPGGWLFVFVPAFQFLWSEHDEANRHFRRYRRQELRGRLERAGFIVKRSSYWNVFLFPPALLVRLVKRLLPRRPETGGRSDLHEAPKLLNESLKLLVGIENASLALGVNWPLGVSVMAVARKPAASRNSEQ